MPHPTPVQIAYGSATVVTSTLLLLLLAPSASPLTSVLIAGTALLLSLAVALAAGTWHRGRAQRRRRITAAVPADAGRHPVPDHPEPALPEGVLQHSGRP